MHVPWFIYILLVANVLQGSFFDQFNAALELHKKKQYQQAFDLYCAIPVKTGNSMFNMGVVAYYEGRYAKAIALWRIACNSMLSGYQSINRTSSAIAQVKKEQLLSAEFSGHPADDPRLLYHAFFVCIWYVHLVPLWILQLLVVIISLFVVGLLFFAMHKAIRRRGLFFAFLFFGIVVSIAMHTIKIRTLSYAIVQECVQMHRGPGDFFEPAGELYPLTELLVETRVSLWCKVRYQDKVGWVPEKALYVIDDHAVCGIDIVNRSDNH